MDKRYQFFISSTFWDLKNIRKEVRQSLLQSGQIPAGMEDFSATGETQMGMIERVLKNCDFCILIIGRRYGTVAKGHDKSYTEREYEYIKDKTKLPILAFTNTHPEELESPEHTETNEKKAKLDKFRDSLHYLSPTPWRDSKELLLSIQNSIMQIRTEDIYPEAIGWVRGDAVVSAESGKNTAIPDIPGLDDPIPSEFLAENTRNIEPPIIITWRHLFLTIAEFPFKKERTDNYVKAVLNKFPMCPDLLDPGLKCKIDDDQLKHIRRKFRHLDLISYHNGIWELTEQGKKVSDANYLARKAKTESDSTVSG